VGDAGRAKEGAELRQRAVFPSPPASRPSLPPRGRHGHDSLSWCNTLQSRAEALLGKLVRLTHYRCRYLWPAASEGAKLMPTIQRRWRRNCPPLRLRDQIKEKRRSFFRARSKAEAEWQLAQELTRWSISSSRWSTDRRATSWQPSINESGRYLPAHQEAGLGLLDHRQRKRIKSYRTEWSKDDARRRSLRSCCRSKRRRSGVGHHPGAGVTRYLAVKAGEDHRGESSPSGASAGSLRCGHTLVALTANRISPVPGAASRRCVQNRRASHLSARRSIAAGDAPSPAATRERKNG